MPRADVHASFIQRFAAPGLQPVQLVDIGALRFVETQLRVAFSNSYIEFITAYGAIFTPGVLDWLQSIGATERADVRSFFAPDEIISAHRRYSSAGMASWFIPIAMDCMGNMFGFKQGSCELPVDDCPVHFFDHDYCQIRQEATSFDSWLASYLAVDQTTPNNPSEPTR